MTQQLVLDPLGIVTEPNKLGQVAAGSLTACNQAVMRSPGVLENMKGWVQHGGTVVSSVAPFHICMPNKWILIIRFNGGQWFQDWLNTDTNITAFTAAITSAAGSASLRTTTQPRFSYVFYGSQLFVSFRSHLLVWDYLDPNNLSESVPRHAGLLPPKVRLPTGLSNGNVTEPTRYTIYTAILKRRIPGLDRVIVSAPATAVYRCNQFDSTTTNTRLDIFTAQTQIKAGDTVEIYRTKSKPTNLSATYTATQPGEEAGSEYLKCGAVTLTAANVAAGYLYYVDTTPDSALGEALYTNQSVGTFADEADTPPACDFVTAYKGFLFGFGPTYSPRIKIRPTGLWGVDTQSVTNASASTVIGTYAVGGWTWTTGSTTLTLASATEAAKVFVGQQIAISGPTWNITNVVGQTVTVQTALPTGQSNATLQVYDVMNITYSFTNVAFVQDWYSASYSINLNNDRSVRALALKLPNIGQTISQDANCVPVDGFELRGEYLLDSRPTLSITSSKPLAWDPRIDPTTPTVVREEYLPHAVCWTNLSEPEAWPVLNQDFFSRGAPQCVAVTADSIIAAYSDGIWRISGTGGSTNAGFDWRYDQIASGITVRGTQCMAVLLDRVYALTSEGLVVIDGDRVTRLSQGRIHDQLDVPGFSDVAHTNASAVFICADEENNEIVFRTPETGQTLWVYNTNTDRFTAIASHDFPVYACYSPYLRAVVFMGQTAGSYTLLSARSSMRGDMSMTFAEVYADNPFSKRTWQTLSVSADVSGVGGVVTITPSFNGLAGATRTLDASGRASFEVPRNAPAVGNTLEIGLVVASGGRSVKLHGFALDYRDQTERRINR